MKPTYRLSVVIILIAVLALLAPSGHAALANRDELYLQEENQK